MCLCLPIRQSLCRFVSLCVCQSSSHSLSPSLCQRNHPSVCHSATRHLTRYSVSLSVNPSVCLSVYTSGLSTRQCVCLHVGLACLATRQSLCLHVSPSVYTWVCLSSRHFFCLHVSLPVYTSVFLVYTSISRFTRQSVCMSVRQSLSHSACLTVNPPVWLSIRLFDCQSPYVSVSPPACHFVSLPLRQSLSQSVSLTVRQSACERVFRCRHRWNTTPCQPIVRNCREVHGFITRFYRSSWVSGHVGCFP